MQVSGPTQERETLNLSKTCLSRTARARRYARQRARNLANACRRRFTDTPRKGPAVRTTPNIFLAPHIKYVMPWWQKLVHKLPRRLLRRVGSSTVRTRDPSSEGGLVALPLFSMKTLPPAGSRAVRTAFLTEGNWQLTFPSFKKGSQSLRKAISPLFIKISSVARRPAPSTVCRRHPRTGPAR